MVAFKVPINLLAMRCRVNAVKTRKIWDICAPRSPSGCKAHIHDKNSMEKASYLENQL